MLGVVVGRRVGSVGRRCWSSSLESRVVVGRRVVDVVGRDRGLYPDIPALLYNASPVRQVEEVVVSEGVGDEEL